MNHGNAKVILYYFDRSALRKSVHVGMMDSKHQILKRFPQFLKGVYIESNSETVIDMDMSIVAFVGNMVVQFLDNGLGLTSSIVFALKHYLPKALTHYLF